MRIAIDGGRKGTNGGPHNILEFPHIPNNTT